MTVQPVPGADPAAFGAAVHSANAYTRAVTSVQSQGTAASTQHTVHAGGGSSKTKVDDGAHGTHDYGVALHPEAVSRFKAHGARLDDHDARIQRLEGSQKLDRGSPEHQKGGK